MSQNRAAVLPMPGIYVCPTLFQGMGKLLAQHPDQPWAASHLKWQAARCDRVRRLVEQGVQLVSGSDAGVSFNAFTDYPGDLILTVEGTDLSPVYVLKSATSVAAEALGRCDLGVIAPGKAADLLAVQGNPLHDIGILVWTLNAPQPPHPWAVGRTAGRSRRTKDGRANLF